MTDQTLPPQEQMPEQVDEAELVKRAMFAGALLIHEASNKGWVDINDVFQITPNDQLKEPERLKILDNFRLTTILRLAMRGQSPTEREPALRRIASVAHGLEKTIHDMLILHDMYGLDPSSVAAIIRFDEGEVISNLKDVGQRFRGLGLKDDPDDTSREKRKKSGLFNEVGSSSKSKELSNLLFIDEPIEFSEPTTNTEITDIVARKVPTIRTEHLNITDISFLGNVPASDALRWLEKGIFGDIETKDEIRLVSREAVETLFGITEPDVLLTIHEAGVLLSLNKSKLSSLIRSKLIRSVQLPDRSHRVFRRPLLKYFVNVGGPDDLYSIRSVSKMLLLPEITVKQIIIRGGIPHVRVPGTQPRIPKRALSGPADD